MKEKEKLFEQYKNGDFSAMKILVESYFDLVDEYLEHYKKKHSDFDELDLKRFIKSALFRRMQICTSIFSYEKDVKRLIQRETIKYMRGRNIKNKKENFDFINLEVDERILKVLNDSLEQDVYYVFYQMISGVSIEDIAKKMDVTLYEIKKRYVYALEVLETFLIKDEKRLKRRLYSINEREGSKSKRIKIVPFSLESIVIYFYLKDTLTMEEKKLYYYQIFSKYEYYPQELVVLLGGDVDLESLGASLNKKINDCLNEEEFKTYYAQMVSDYGPYLYNLVKSENLKKFDFSSIREVVNILAFDDIKKFLSDDFAYITPNEKKLLYKYYYRKSRHSAEVEDIERDINLNLFGYKQRKNDIMPRKYYQTYLDNLGEFDETQRLFLECFYFKIRDKRDFLEANADSRLYYRYYYLTDRLEKLYYNIRNFTDNTFNRKKWLSIRDRYKEKYSEERVKLMDLFYGVDGEPMPIKEIHKKFYPNLTYIKVHDLVSDAREAAINVYINKKHKIDIKPEDYLPYLTQEYEYTDDTRKILLMFLRDNRSYDEISKEMGLNKTRISNIITDGIRRIDHYRLGILHARKIDGELLNAVYEYFPDSFSDQDKEIYRLKFICGKNNDEIAEEVGIPKKDVNSRMGVLYKKLDKYAIRDVEITYDDVKEELERHFTDTVIEDYHQRVLSLYYGVKNKFNPTGEAYRSKDIQKMLNISNNQYYRHLQGGQELIKLRKVNRVWPFLWVMPRNEIPQILEDVHLPISDKERFIINSLFELNGHKYMTVEELAEYYGENDTSIRRRYLRAMVSIKKYLNGELDEQINYEEDIVPLLKYFSRSDRIYIYEHYKNNVSYKNIAKKYHMSPDMVLAILNRIRITIYEMTHSEKKDKLFDFDYYYEAIENPDLPFYGNLEIARQIFELYFGMNEMRRLSIPEIKERLGLDVQTTSINNAVYSIMISVCKLKEGIKKQREFTYEEIVDYYERHKDEMDSVHRVYYDRYFMKVKHDRNINGKVTKISEMITYDLLKEREPNLFKLDTASKADMERILNDKSFILDSKTKHTLLERINPHGELDGRDINHIYRIINSLLERNLLFIDKGKSYRLGLYEQ